MGNITHGVFQYDNRATRYATSTSPTPTVCVCYFRTLCKGGLDLKVVVSLSLSLSLCACVCVVSNKSGPLVQSNCDRIPGRGPCARLRVEGRVAHLNFVIHLVVSLLLTATQCYVIRNSLITVTTLNHNMQAIIPPTMHHLINIL